MSRNNKYPPLLINAETPAEQFLQLLPLARIIVELCSAPGLTPKDFDEFERIALKAIKLADDNPDEAGK